MVAYWLMVLLPTMIALGQPRSHKKQQSLLLATLLVAIFFLMALRETGGDFSTYLELFEILQREPLQVAMDTIEPGYGILNWLSATLGLGIYGVNAACALVFLYCLSRLARQEQHPLLVLALAMPYFVIVVGMGYTRQGVAAAFLMLAVALLRERHPARAAIAVALGSTFHYSAMIGMALPLLATTHHQRGAIRIVARLLMLPVLLVSLQYAFSNRIETYKEYYIEQGLYESGGALLRSLVTGAAAAVFFLRRREFKTLYDDYGIWRPIAFLGLFSVPLSLVASTAVDRIGLYLIPFQLVTFARLPVAYRGGRYFSTVRLVVIAGYLVYFFVWLHLGNYAKELWIPYRWIFSEP